MDDLLNCTLRDFLDGVAARRPTPGGGSVAALSGALACALGQMVANYSIGRKDELDQAPTIRRLHDQLAEINSSLQGLVNRDAAAYQALSTLNKSSATYDADRQTALNNAIAIPMDIVSKGAVTLQVLNELKNHAKGTILSDLGAAAALALASVRSAAYMVRANFAEQSVERSASRLGDELEHHLRAAAEHLAVIERYLTLDPDSQNPGRKSEVDR